MKTAELITLKSEKIHIRVFKDTKIKNTIIIQTRLMGYHTGRLKETYIQSQT